MKLLVLTSAPQTSIAGLLCPLLERAVEIKRMESFYIVECGTLTHRGGVTSNNVFDTVLVYGYPDQRSHLVLEALDRPYTVVMDGASLSCFADCITEPWERYVLTTTVANADQRWELVPGLIARASELGGFGRAVAPAHGQLIEGPSRVTEQRRPVGVICWLPPARDLRDTGQELFHALDKIARWHGVKVLLIGCDRDRIGVPTGISSLTDLGSMSAQSLLRTVAGRGDHLAIVPHDYDPWSSRCLVAEGTALDRCILLRRLGVPVIETARHSASPHWDSTLQAIFEARGYAVGGPLGPWLDADAAIFVERAMEPVSCDDLTLDLFRTLWAGTEHVGGKPGFVLPPVPPPRRLAPPVVGRPRNSRPTTLESRGKPGTEHYQSLLLNPLPSGTGGQFLLEALRRQVVVMEGYLGERGL